MADREKDTAGEALEETVRSTPIGEDDTVVEQQNVGPGGEAGGGEWPDPDTPPTGSAPGSGG
jgi:hypothetical protein